MEQMQDGSTHKIANSIRSCVLIVMLFVIVLGLVFGGAVLFHGFQSEWKIMTVALPQAIDYIIKNMHYILLGTLGWIGIALVFNRAMISFAGGGRVVDLKSCPRISKIMKPLAKRAELEIPKIAIIDTLELNAFASGMSESSYTVTLSRGLVKELDDEELAGVIAHELAHIENGDVRLLVIAATITGGIGLLLELIMEVVWRASFLFSNFFLENEEISEMVSGFVVLLLCFPVVTVAWLISKLINLALPRSREYLADATAAELTGHPEALASALNKISQNCNIKASSGVMAMCIDRPKTVLSLLSTHPEIDDRITALQSTTVRSVAGTQQLQNNGKPVFGQRKYV